MNPSDWQGPFILSLVCALVDGLKSMEKPRSARYNRLSKVEEAAFKAISFYPQAKLTPEVMELATEFFEKVEAQFSELAP